MSSEIENRLTMLESRLTKIESHLRPAASSVPQLTVTQESIDAWADDSKIKPRSSAKPAPQIVEEKNPINWLGVAAVFCFVLAAGFIIKLSIDSGWLTPARQVGMSALLGFSLIGAGIKLMSSDREYASLLPGAGIIILYLTALASHLFYDLVSFEGSLVLIGLVSALCITLYVRIRHDVYAITASLGAYLSPLLLGGKGFAEISLSYFLLASVAFAIISIFVKSRTLLLISANLAILMTAFIGFDLQKDMMVSINLALHFMIFSISTYFYSRRNQTPLTEDEAWSFFPVLLAFYGMEYFFINNIAPHLAPWISLSFAGFLFALYLSAKSLFPNGLGSQKLILTFTTLVCFHSLYVELLPVSVHPWLLVAIILAVAFMPQSMVNSPKRGIYFIPLVAVGFISAIEYLSIVLHLFDAGNTQWIAVAMASLISLWVLFVNRGNELKEKMEGYYALLGSAHLLAILGFYRLTTDAGSLAVSASWLFYAVAVMLFASMRKDVVMAKSALIVLGFAAGKALLYDAANAPTLLRIICLLMTGVVLYGCGFLMRKISTWSAVEKS